MSEHEPSARGQLGDFRILREIGRGGMGFVYEAEQISLGRRVALKILPFAELLDERQLQRFQNEVRTAALLDHPHIVRIHAVGRERGVHYYAMQLIRGRNLAELISELQGTTPPGDLPSPGEPTAEAATPKATDLPSSSASSLSPASRRSRDHYRALAQLGLQAAQALAYAHQLGIVHRDIKPSNLLLDARGQLYVTDFGLAMTAASSHLTITGDVLGTLRYMSPEQIQGQRPLVDHRTDVYSLGATLYELLTLQPAYEQTDRRQIIDRILYEPPPDPRRRNRTIPRDLARIVRQSMAKSADERYLSAEALADDLDRFLHGRPILARGPSLRHRLLKWGRRNPVAAVAWIALVLAVGIAAAAMTAYLVGRARHGTVVQEQMAAALQDRETIKTLLLAAESADDPIQAVAYYEAVRELAPDNQNARLGLIRNRRLAVQMHRQREEFDEAVAMLEQLIKSDPEETVSRPIELLVSQSSDPPAVADRLIALMEAVGALQGLDGLYEWRSTHRWRRGEVQAALADLQRFRDIRRMQFGTEPPLDIRIQARLVELLIMTGDYVQADHLLRGMFQDPQESSPWSKRSDFELVRSVGQMVRLYRSVEQEVRAVAILDEFVDFYQNVLSRDGNETQEMRREYTRLLVNLASLYHALGQTTKAASYLEVIENDHDPETIAWDQALLYESMGAYDRADMWFHQFVETSAQQVCPDQVIGEHEEKVENWSRQAVDAVARKLAGSGSQPGFLFRLSKHGETLRNLGAVYRARDAHARADIVFREAIEIYAGLVAASQEDADSEKWPGYDVYVATQRWHYEKLFELGDLYREVGDVVEADKLLQQLVTILESVGDEAHRTHIRVLHSLAELRWEQADLDAAVELHRRAIALRKIASRSVIDYASELHRVGLVFADGGQYDAARDLLEQALAIRFRNLGDRSFFFQQTARAVVDLYQTVGDVDEAEALKSQFPGLFAESRSRQTKDTGQPEPEAQPRSAASKKPSWP